MRNIINPGQQELFDPFERIFSPLAYKTIKNGWQGLFRHVILELMPAEVLGGEFHPNMGRPTKELYSMAGLIFISDFIVEWPVGTSPTGSLRTGRESLPSSGSYRSAYA